MNGLVKDELISNNNNSILKGNTKQEIEDKLLVKAEAIWEEYPNKKGHSTAINSIVNLLKGNKVINKKKYKLSFEELLEATMNYAEEVKGTDKQFIKHGSTFYNGTILDYLEGQDV